MNDICFFRFYVPFKKFDVGQRLFCKYVYECMEKMCTTRELHLISSSASVVLPGSPLAEQLHTNWTLLQWNWHLIHTNWNLLQRNWTLIHTTWTLLHLHELKSIIQLEVYSNWVAVSKSSYCLMIYIVLCCDMIVFTLPRVQRGCSFTCEGNMG